MSTMVDIEGVDWDLGVSAKPLDPAPYRDYADPSGRYRMTVERYSSLDPKLVETVKFNPGAGYSQNIEDYQ